MTPHATGTEAHLPAGGCGMTGAGQLRQAAFGIAYRMLGRVTDAEDVAQEALLRYHSAAGRQTINSPPAYLTTVTTRLAIDALRRARARRERYVAPWVPGPLLIDDAPGVAERAEIADSLSQAFLVLLESLSPVERAVYLLHDVFDYGYDEAARIVGKSEDNCRQLAVRARRHVADKRPRFEASRRQRDRLAAAFFAACQAGELQGLVGLLSDDVVMYGDGVGRARAACMPHVGPDTCGSGWDPAPADPGRTPCHTPRAPPVKTGKGAGAEGGKRTGQGPAASGALCRPARRYGPPEPGGQRGRPPPVAAPTARRDLEDFP